MSNGRESDVRMCKHTRMRIRARCVECMHMDMDMDMDTVRGVRIQGSHARRRAHATRLHLAREQQVQV